MKDDLSLVDKSGLFLSGLCILLLIFLASEARADQQGFDEFVSRANATQFTDAQLNRMILGKQYDCELNVAAVTMQALENFSVGDNRDNAVMIEEAVNECYHFNEEATLGFVKMMIKNKHPKWLKK